MLLRFLWVPLRRGEMVAHGHMSARRAIPGEAVHFFDRRVPLRLLATVRGKAGGPCLEALDDVSAAVLSEWRSSRGESRPPPISNESARAVVARAKARGYKGPRRKAAAIAWLEAQA